MLKLTKKGDKYWLFEDSEIGLFSPSKFTINLELNQIVIVYENGLKSKRYNVIDCEIYDLGELSPFTTSSGDLFMQKLEELNCPCFQKNENIFNITGGNWGEIGGTLSDQTDLQTALDSKLDKVSTTGVERAYIINADGSQGTKATSDFSGQQNIEVITLQNRWTLTNENTYYRSRFDYAGFNDMIMITTTGASSYATLTQIQRSQSSFFYYANGAKKLHKIIVDVGSIGSTTTSYTLMVVACQRVSTNSNNDSTINGIDLGEYTMTKASGNINDFHILTPNDVTIPDGYIVTCFLKRADGTAEINCSIMFQFKNA